MCELTHTQVVGFPFICFNILVHWVLMLRLHPACTCPPPAQAPPGGCGLVPSAARDRALRYLLGSHLGACQWLVTVPSLDRGPCRAPHAASFIISLYCFCAGNKVGVIKLECGRHIRFPVSTSCRLPEPLMVPLGIFAHPH